MSAPAAEKKTEPKVPEVPFTYLLKRPITIEDKDASGVVVASTTVSKVRFEREPELASLRKIFKRTDRFDRLVKIIEELTDWPKDLYFAIEKLNFRDVDGLGDVARPFFEEDEDSPDDSSPDAPSA